MADAADVVNAGPGRRHPRVTSGSPARAVLGTLVGLAALGTSSAAATGLPGDLPGWEATRWGMSRAEVRARVPARPAEASQVYADGVSPFRIPVRVGAYTLDAFPVFAHADGGLIRVELRPRALAAGLWDTLYARLVARLGTPERRRGVSDEDAEAYHWRFPSTVVTLLRTDLQVGRLRRVVLVYRTARPRPR